ncbi:MAG: GMC oxidoreductase [Nitrospiraceae bacterium]
MVPSSYDVIVIGSGFGGAVTACRLAEKGLRILVLERGRRWDPVDYPRKPKDAWIWDQDKPEKRNGWVDFRFFQNMWVAQGAAVGGGSLIYANVFIEAKREAFHVGWPQEITYDELKPYYDKVGRMLNVQSLPETQATERYKLMKNAAQRLGYGSRFHPVPLAVTFNPDWTYGLPDPFDDRHSKSWTNAQGQQQGTCVHCGNCDIGCQVKAKNTLDLNYIPWAERHGAQIRPLHLVRCITPQARGYRVDFDRIEKGRLLPGYETADRVILAAGSLGSTELLLRCRDQYKTLPRLSRFLGYNWSSNGDFLTPARYEHRRISPTQGPTITCAIDFLDAAVDNQQFFVEDGGFPDVLGNYLEAKLEYSAQNWRVKVVFGALKRVVRARDPLSNLMPWFGQAVDASDGRLYLGRHWLTPWRKKLRLCWDIEPSEAAINALVNMHKRLSEATGGTPRVPLMWRMFRNLITPHPLGGCNMGSTREIGVVDHRGEVFGYPHLYVADGAIVPRAIGLNPSRTIAALAERITDQLLQNEKAR